MLYFQTQPGYRKLGSPIAVFTLHFAAKKNPDIFPIYRRERRRGISDVAGMFAWSVQPSFLSLRPTPAWSLRFFVRPHHPRPIVRSRVRVRPSISFLLRSDEQTELTINRFGQMKE